ncbi:hypothetical protein [Kistimonas asteriae]|uniref:hypothetical protein n=1 Tax=Kistimonas asteriae TaxID=517724 RepID=UPI001BA49323|nr:hypothetical protein [Kistimonas asteriae]
MKTYILIFLISYSSYIYANELPMEKFIHVISNNYTKVHCSESGYGGACFAIPTTECKVSIRSHIKQCFLTLRKEIPQSIATKEEASLWSGKIMQCAGENFHHSHDNRFQFQWNCATLIGKTVKHNLFNKTP